MPFCQNCGAQMNAAFCTACGTRAKDAEAPSPQVNAAAAPRKTSPLVWILAAVAGLFVLIGILIVGAGFFVVHKARQAGLDPELMKNNPGLATAKLLAATNPDLEVVSVDDGRGRITIRQKSTGKTMSVSFDEMKHGKITFREDGKEAVTLEAHGDGQDGTLQMKSGNESVTIGANQATLPAWIPAYPNAKTQSNFSMNNKDGVAASFQFQTRDAGKDVLTFYEKGLKENGFKVTTTSTSDSGTASSGIISAENEAEKRTVMITVGNDDKGATVSVTYSQK
jgi:hypothetical protein